MAYELVATSDYLKVHESFLLKVDLSEYLIEYYQHRKNISEGITSEQDEKLKDLIACFALHLSARTALETHAWTLSIVSEKPYSLFVTGTTGEMDESGVAKGFLVGNILTENIRHTDTNGFHAQCIHRGKTFNSYVPCDSSHIASMVEAFYRQSEQRPIKIKISDNSDTAIGLSALPGFDEEWFESVSLDELNSNIDKLEKTRMRNCKFSFSCDCSPDKLLPFFSTLTTEAINELYGADDELQITCPRCGRQFAITRDMVVPKSDDIN